jgi:hypothetical protein
MEFAAMESNRLRVGNKASSCLLTRGEGNHGKYLKTDFWRCNCSRKHRNSSIGCPQGEANFCSSEWICHAKQPKKRLGSVVSGIAVL